MTDSPYDGDTAILYARVSTDDHDQDPQTQVRNMTKWCEANGVEILETFVEERSAKDTNRPGLQAALGYLTLNKVGILLAWSESRLSRDTDDMAKIVAICKTNRVRIRYVSADGINPEEGTGKVMNFLNTWQAEEERKKLSLNTKQGLESARLKGKHCGRMLAFCFTHRVKECEKMIAVDAKKPTVIMSIEDVMEFARQGYSVAGVAKKFAHVAPNTLRKALMEEGRLEEFVSLCGKARSDVQQRGGATKGASTPENGSTKGVGE